MRKFLLAALVLSSSVSAQVIECPEYLSSNEVSLSGIPTGQKGSARLLPARLSYAYMQNGELFSSQVDAPPASSKLKGGWNTEYRFTPDDTKWLVCVYGGNEWNPGKQTIAGIVDWWGKVDEKATSCVLTVRKTKLSYDSSGWTATAVCK